MNRKKILTVAGTLMLGIILGAGLMMVDDVHIAVKKAVGSDVTSNYLNQAYNHLSSDMDIETMMMMVQTQRANNLDAQLASQIEEVKMRNEQLNLLNLFRSQLVSLETSLDNIRSTDPIPETFVSEITEIQTKYEELFLKKLPNENIRLKRHVNELIHQVNEKIDNLNSSAQLDLMRLQQLSNKRNEAFEQMASFMDKMQRTRDDILRNMR